MGNIIISYSGSDMTLERATSSQSTSINGIAGSRCTTQADTLGQYSNCPVELRRDVRVPFGIFYGREPLTANYSDGTVTFQLAATSSMQPSGYSYNLRVPVTARLQAVNGDSGNLKLQDGSLSFGRISLSAMKQGGQVVLIDTDDINYRLNYNLTYQIDHGMRKQYTNTGSVSYSS